MRKLDGAQFEPWMKSVDAHLTNLVAMDSMDLADCAYWDYWDSDMDSKQGALEALSCQDFFTVEQLQAWGWEG
jgi:hypothetical protein